MSNSKKGNKVKILFIHHTTGWGGAAINMMNIINGLDKLKYIIEVLLIQNSIISKILEENNITVKIAKSSFYKRFYTFYTHSAASISIWYRIDTKLKLITSWLLNRFYFASKELQNHQFDIVHLNSSFLTDWLAPCKTKGKVIMHIQEPFSMGHWGLRYSFFTSQMRKYADIIIAISNDNARRINIPEKTHVVYNFVEISENSEINCNSESKVLYLGGYHETKGFFTVVHALDYLEQNIKIVFCGDYMSDIKVTGFRNVIKKKIKYFLPFHRKFKAALLKIKNHPNAMFVGLVNNTAQLIRDSEFLISPFSRPHFSRPVIEAFANKKCVIGSNVEGMDEIIDHEINGLIVEKDNPVELAQAINYLHANPEKRNEMGENGYLKARNLFSPFNIMQIQKIYENLIE